MPQGDILRSGLDRLHAELSREMQTATKEVLRLRKAIQHVEAVIKLVAPDGDMAMIANRRRRRRILTFKRGEIGQAVYQTLRETAEPLTVKEIALACLLRKGVTGPDKVALYHLEHGIRNLFRTWAGETVTATGFPRKWALITRDFA
ncbi:MAG TPA: hypothetical protein VIJ42_09335 [Stellaceae bacterium]